MVIVVAKRRKAARRITLLLSFAIITQPPYGLTGQAVLCSSQAPDRRFVDAAVLLGPASAGQLAVGYYWEESLSRSAGRGCACRYARFRHPPAPRAAVHPADRVWPWPRWLPIPLCPSLDDRLVSSWVLGAAAAGDRGLKTHRDGDSHCGRKKRRPTY